MASNYDIFKDTNPDALIRIWENERKTRDFAVKLMWENMKYFGALIGSLLTAQMALLGYIYSKSEQGNFPFYVSLFLFFAPTIIIFLCLYARKDLTDRRRRFFLVVSHLLKLEDILGLHKDISQILTSFREDKFLFAEYQKNLSKCNNTEDFIKLMMCDKKGAFSLMQRVYLIMMAIAIIFIILQIIFLTNSIISLQTIYSI